MENDLKKGGKSIRSIAKLAEPPPVGEVEIGGVRRSDDQAMLQSEHTKWSKIWGMEEEVDPDPWNKEGPGTTVPGPADWRAIKAVARSFPWVTFNYEGMSPQAHIRTAGGRAAAARPAVQFVRGV